MLKKFLKRFEASPRGQERRREPRKQVDDGDRLDRLSHIRHSAFGAHLKQKD